MLGPKCNTRVVEARRPRRHRASGKGPAGAHGLAPACVRACMAPAPARVHVFRHNGSKAMQPGSPLCTANKGPVITGRGSRADKRIQNFNICCHKGIRRSETQSISLVSAGRAPISKSSGGQRGQERKRKEGGERKKEITGFLKEVKKKENEKICQ